MKDLMVRKQAFRGLFANRAAIVLLAVLITAAPFHTALSATAPSLGMAESFAILGGSTVTNTGSTTIIGDVGLSPGTAVTGFPPGLVTGGTIHATDAVAGQAQSGTTTAYNNLAGQTCTSDLTSQDLGGLTLVPGTYCFSSSAQLTGALTLNAGGDSNAVWVFKIGTTLTTASNSSVLLINGGQICNVFWQVGSSATLGTTTTFIGNILALQSITLTTNANMSGRALARNGAVTLDSNDVAISACAVPPVTPIPPTLGKTFGPATIDAGGTSILTITLSNADVAAASLTAPLIDTLPSGVVVAAGLQTNDCGGLLTATTGSSTVTLALLGSSIPAKGSCTITVPVTAPGAGSYFNSLGIGALQTNHGINAAPAVGTLTVLPISGVALPTLGKAFNLATIPAGGISTLTITLSNTAAIAANLTAPLIDTLPSGVFIATTPNAGNTCGGAVTATPGASTVTLTGGSILANSSCNVTVNVTAPVGGSYFNSLAAGSLQTGNGNNTAPAVATLTVLPSISPLPGLLLSKTPNPTTYKYVGQVIVYTYVVKNIGDVTLTGPFTVTDDKLGSFTCGSATSLAPGASVTCTKDYTIQAGDLGNVASLPTGVTAIIHTGAWLQGLMSTQDTTISDAGALNGIYPGWCIQDRILIDLHNQPATLYSTIGNSLPTDVAGLSWNKVNYVLNHKIRGDGNTDLEFFKDVQTAIWVLLGEPNPEFGVSAAAQQMINEANAHPNFVPGPGDVVAVIVYSDGMTTNPDSIQESIVEMKLLQTIVNHATASGKFGDVIVQSGQVEATVNQTLATLPTLPVPFESRSATIWPATSAPLIADSGPDSAVELGVKFRSDTSGYINGIRFYKSGGNSGTHTGSLWKSNGTLLATATFINESASGWQQVNFAKPVAISANTVYVASYHTNSGHYSCDQNFFAGKGVDSPPLHAPANGVSGVNGVYIYGATGKFPNQGWNSSNYWVDVSFSASAATPPEPTGTIFTSQIPALYENDDDYELGTRFRTDANGQITQVRLYTNALEGGTHAVRIWRVTDMAVVAGPYTWNIASGSVGWKSFTLPAPLIISANTDYIVAISNSADRYYAAELNGFDAPIVNGHLYTYTGSGVYSTVSGAMPTSIWKNTNYFRDVVFVP